MGKRKVDVPLEPNEAQALSETELDAIIENGTEPNGLTDKEGNLIDDRYGPPMWSEAWSDFVISQFKPNELNGEGCPDVNGLRRVVRKVIGPILFSGPTSVGEVNYLEQPGTKDWYKVCRPVTCVYTVKVMWTRPEHGPDVLEYSDAADVMFGNTDTEFLRFPSATAATRAEARCLRKMLQLAKVAAVETTTVPIEEAMPDGTIRESDILFINEVCRRLNVNVVKFINSGKKKYESVNQVPFGTGQKIMEFLSGLETNPQKIDEKMIGYDAKWRDNWKEPSY